MPTVKHRPTTAITEYEAPGMASKLLVALSFAQLLIFQVFGFVVDLAHLAEGWPDVGFLGSLTFLFIVTLLMTLVVFVVIRRDYWRLRLLLVFVPVCTLLALLGQRGG
jgi:multisubunit Na+/H+ antiporter MnhB subunit